MAQNKNPNQQSGDCGCNDCDEKDNITQQIITAERDSICQLFINSSGEMTKQEEKFEQEKSLYNQRKCFYLNTEENYRRYRNLDISVGTELAQTNELIKGNVSMLASWNKELSKTLKDIAAKVKDAKTKFGDLRKTSNDLKNSLEDSCNKAQRKALTGRADCKGEERGENREDTKLPEACKDACAILDDLVCIPQGLSADIDSIFKAAYDVVGIQVFTNVDTLGGMQTDLDKFSATFKTHIAGVVTKRETELKEQQKDLVKSVQEITRAAMNRNTARSTFQGYQDAVDFLCCAECDCVFTTTTREGEGCDGCKPRLEKCEEQICEICKVVKVTFCCTPNDSEEAAERANRSVH